VSLRLLDLIFRSASRLADTAQPPACKGPVTTVTAHERVR
jgi:hypothetical protein